MGVYLVLFFNIKFKFIRLRNSIGMLFILILKVRINIIW